jgi:hypothetical protein
MGNAHDNAVDAEIAANQQKYADLDQPRRSTHNVEYEDFEVQLMIELIDRELAKRDSIVKFPLRAIKDKFGPAMAAMYRDSHSGG